MKMGVNVLIGAALLGLGITALATSASIASPATAALAAFSTPPADAARVPAWREPGFVMDEVVVTVRAVRFDAYVAREPSVDFEALLQLHRESAAARPDTRQPLLD